jgi:hypothetical protein
MKEDYVLVMKKDFTPFYEFFQNISEKKETFIVSITITAYSHLLKAFQLLQKNDIIYGNYPKIGFTHQDLPILFDFEKSWIDFNWNQREMHDILSYLPIEAHLLYFLQSNETQSLSLDNIRCVCENYSTIVRFSSTPGFSLFAHLVNQPKEVLIKELTTYKYTWDIFGMSILFLEVLDSFSLNKRGEISEDIVSTFMNQLNKSIHVDASKRPNMESLLSGLAAFAVFTRFS